jgi:hypothetical protein
MERALQGGDAAEIAEALLAAWSAMEEVGLEVPFARLYGDALPSQELPGPAGELAHRIALLAPSPETAARARSPVSTREAVWRAVATGEVAGVTAPDAPSAAVLAGFQSEPPADMADALAEGRTGEAILQAIQGFQRGQDGDMSALSAAIATLRAAGQDEAARQAALQYLLLDARA